MIAISYSGGKDSNAMLIKAIEEGIEFKAVYQDTGFEHSSHYDYIRYVEKALCVEIEFVKSKKYNGMIDMIEKKVMLPASHSRFCTDNLKQQPFKEWLGSRVDEIKEVWIGVRTAESRARAERYGGIDPEDTFPLSEFPIYGKRKFGHIDCRLPIVTWTDEEVWESHYRHNLKRNPAYDIGAKRVGCFPCLMAGDSSFWTVWQTEEGRRNIEKLADLEDFVNKTRESEDRTHDYRIRRKGSMRNLIETFKLKDTQQDMFNDSCDLSCSWCQG
ncbi:MAG: phosphoadenosine phosphosulfate reductase family protein [Candidatus Marinimicrobia bacterium]|jgi:3'-phosphoadenosine 5'-phosphosulfate sulfotransferase (PAPS reductase)/FAD synthetase|nr:phosphoadenosine phosphosulfate reductase family protein [Candidatus Neomarinimicrobiota bacterium]